jgi:hypothetical protein
MAHHVHIVYDLPSTTHTVHYPHAAHGFQPKPHYFWQFTTAIYHSNLTTFPGLTTTNVAKHFLKNDETQMGHMKQIKQAFAPPNPKRTTTIPLPNPVASTAMYICMFLMPPKR